MTNVHLSYEHFVKLLNVFPESNVKWLCSDFELPKCVMDPKYYELEVVQRLLDINDFPKFKKSETESKFQFLGEVIERKKDKKPNIKQFRKVFKEIKKLKNEEQIQEFLNTETKLRKENRKIALTKKLEQKSWKELKSAIKPKLLQKEGLIKIQDFLINYIICSEHKGQSCPEVCQAQNRSNKIQATP